MSNFVRQQANALRKLHLEVMGPRIDPACSWYHDSKSDIYHCPHTAIYGKDLMERMPDWQNLNDGNQARTDWVNNPDSNHTI